MLNIDNGQSANMFHSNAVDTNVVNPYTVIDAENEVLDGSLNLTNGCTRLPLNVAKYIYENHEKGLYIEVYEQKNFEEFDEDAQVEAVNTWSKKLRNAKSNEEVAKMEKEINEAYGADVWERIVAKTVWEKNTVATIDKSSNTDVTNRDFAKKGSVKSKKTKSK